MRGFLELRNESGAVVADGDSTQITRHGQVINRMTYHFKDGSLQDETAIFSQSGHFRVLSDHLVQKGPTFKRAIDLLVNGITGAVKVTYSDDGKEKTETANMKLPPDLANGIVPVLLKNLPTGQQSVTESMVVASPKPMLIKLQIHSVGEDTFLAGSAKHTAMRYQIKVDIGGVKGVIAPLVGKQPPDTYVWISEGDCPSFVKAQGPGFEGGPIWATELVSPTWPRTEATSATREKTGQ